MANPWDVIQHVSKVPFRLASKIGEGANCAVYSLGHVGKDVWYSEEDDSETYSNCTSDTSSSVSSHSASKRKGKGKDKKKRDKKARSASLSSPSPPRKQGKKNRPSTAGGARAAPSSSSSSSEGEDDVRAEGESSEEVSPEEFEAVMEALRVHRDSPVGRVQVVAKRFSHLDDERCFAIIDGSTNAIVKVCPEEEECGDYMRRRQWSESQYYVQEMVHSATSKNVKCYGFETEAIVTLAVSDLAVRNLTPHVCLATEALQERNTGYLVLERIDGTLDDLLNDDGFEAFCLGSKSTQDEFTPTQMAGMFFQTLFAMVVLQRTLRIKHHDLHSSNVFIKKIGPSTSFRGQLLNGATHFHYNLDGTNFYVPSANAIIKIGDFGMSSIDLDGKRIERLDMDVFNDNVEKWGYWSSNFDGERGYDTQLLFSDIPVDGHWRKSRELHRLMKALKTSALGKKGKVTRRKGRPLPGHVSNQPADALIQSVFLRNAEAWYNFRELPTGENVRIVTLGDSRYFT